MKKRIVYTRHDGGVSVCCPAPEIFTVMSSGGYWDDQPRGYVETQIERQIAAGIAPDHARRFAHAVAFGGATEAEVWGIVRDRDCARYGTLHELMDFDDLPGRWFRNAWYRSANGGPVGVDLKRAKEIQFYHIRTVEDVERRRHGYAMNARPIDVPWITIESAIRNAIDESELVRVWPEALPKPKELPLPV